MSSTGISPAAKALKAGGVAVPVPAKTKLAEVVAVPVPPFAIGNTPVTPLAKSVDTFDHTTLPEAPSVSTLLVLVVVVVAFVRPGNCKPKLANLLHRRWIIY